MPVLGVIVRAAIYKVCVIVIGMPVKQNAKNNYLPEDLFSVNG